MKYKYICDDCGSAQPCILKVNDRKHPPLYCPWVRNCVAPWRLYKEPKKACKHEYYFGVSSTAEGSVSTCVCLKCGERVKLRSN